MKTISINAEKRTELGKKSTRDLRKADNVPCVMYGGAEVLHFYAHENEFRHMVYTPNAYIIEVKLDGKVHKAIMQDLQFHPVTDKLYHLDFVEVFDGRPVTMEIPIKLTGAAIGLKDGGKQRQSRRVIKVRGLLEHFPDTLEIDITEVGVGDVIKVGDLEYDNLEVLDPSRSMIYSIVSSRVSAKGMEMGEDEAAAVAEAEAAAAAAAEGGEGAEGGAPAEESTEA